MGCYLIIKSDQNRRVPLAEKPGWMLGRGRGNDIIIDHVSMSRRHAMLQVTESGEVFLVDLGSRNGSFLNGYRVGARVKLSDGDQITFGEVVVEFHSATSEKTLEPEICTIAGTIPVQQRRMLSVLVIDIRDFTVLSREIGEQKLAELMGNLFRRAGEIIRKHASRMDKYIGDALMAVWFHDETGAPDPQTLRPLQALCALHRMIETLNGESTLPFPLRIGAGINTGYAMVGNSGSPGSADYTALGDTVNAAFRLESATKEIGCDIAIGESTHRRLLQVTAEGTPFIRNDLPLKGLGRTIAYSCSFAELHDYVTHNASNAA